MFSARLALCGLLLSAPLPGRSQAEAPAPRFYVGLGAYSSYYQRLGHQNFGGFRLPVQLTAGYQWRPRLAVQLGVAYSGSSNSYSYQGYLVGADGSLSPIGRSGRASDHSTSVSALARYTLTRQLTHRLQFDLLGGLTLEHDRYRDQGSLSDSVQTGTFDNQYSTTVLHAAFGPGVRYRLGSSFELFGDYLFNLCLATSQAYSPGRVTTAGSLGLRYRFGTR
jgi:hypothetical protein